MKLRGWWTKWRGRGASQLMKASNAYAPSFEALEDRRMLAVTATFSPSSGVLSVYGDSLDNTIEVSRNSAGRCSLTAELSRLSAAFPRWLTRR